MSAKRKKDKKGTVEVSAFCNPGRLTLRHMDSMSSKSSPLPHQRSRLGQQARHFAAHKLVAGRLLAIRVESVRVADIPCPARRAVIVRYGFFRSGELGALGIESVAVWVLWASDWCIGGDSIIHEDRVFGTVHVGVNAKAEEVLVVVCVDTYNDLSVLFSRARCGISSERTGIHLSAPALGVLARVDGVGVEDTGQLDLWLDRSILLKVGQYA